MSQKLESAPAEVLKFEYKHPNNGESHTVSVTREEVSHHMCDVLFEKLCAEFCECEPVGETNVVDCRCDEYADEFERVPLASPMPPAGEKMEFDKLAHEQVIAVCRTAAFNCTEQHSYMAGLKTDYRNWFPHKWVIDAMRALIGVNQSTCSDLRAHVTRLQAENAALQQRLNIADQRVDELEPKAKLYDQLQRGAELLPEGWMITVEVERDGGGVTLIDPQGNDLDYPSNHESMGDEVEDAIEEALSQQANP